MIASSWLASHGLMARPVVSTDDVEWMRLCRNAGRHGFVFDQREITPEAQAVFWRTRPEGLQAWIVEDAEGPVAYGLLRPRYGCQWWSVAVAPHARGRGYGAVLTTAVSYAPETVWSMVRRDNAAAVTMHRAARWDLCDIARDTMTFRSVA